jgi:ketosteroid isomerase-like protein
VILDGTLSRANVDLVVHIYEAWNGGDYAGIVELVGDEFEFHDAPQFPQARILIHEDARRYLRNLTFDLQVEIERLKVAGDEVLAFLRERRRGGSAVADFRFAHLWTIRDGRASCLKLFFDWGEAWDELGLQGEDA